MSGSYNKSLFEGVPNKDVRKSRFNLSHEWKGQFIPGMLHPCMLLETLPNDEFEIQSEFMFRFEPMYFPVMHKMTMRADYYFCPNRILWTEKSSTDSGWQKWISEQKEQVLPYTRAEMKYDTTTFNNHVLQFMGIPVFPTTTNFNTVIGNLNAFPLSMYLKIWDEYYRNPQLESEMWFPLVAGDNSDMFRDAYDPNHTGLAYYFPCMGAKWEMDYFTSCLPTPQIGEAVTIPTVEFDEDGIAVKTKWSTVPDYPNLNNNPGTVSTDATGGMTDDSGNPLVLLPSATIRQLRLAEALQSYYERILKVGQRYRDFIKGMFGNDPEPGVIDRPVLIDSVFGRVQISDTLTTATTDSGTTQTGDYQGNANLYKNADGKSHYKCMEHGFIMCILQLNPNTSYGQGIHRMWRRTVQTDYPLDMFSAIGDQEVLKEEVLYNFKTAENSKNLDTFGYIPRHSEMRYQNNLHIGLYNYGVNKSQHLGRVWDAATVTGVNYDANIQIRSQFVTATPLGIGGIRITDVFRILPSGITTNPASGVAFAHIYHSVYVNRALPVYATPDLT